MMYKDKTKIMPLNVYRDRPLSPIESIETLKTSRLNPFYCTRCGTYHDAITPCPRCKDDIYNKYSYFYQMYNINTTQNSPQTVQTNEKKAPQIVPQMKSDPIVEEINPYDHCQIHQNVTCAPKCVTFNLDNLHGNAIESCTNLQDKCIDVSCEADLKDMTQGTDTIMTNEQGTDSFDNDDTFFDHFGWCSFHERLHGAGYNYPYGGIILPAITEIEETQILENKSPPGPWTLEGKIYRKRILKFTYPPQSKEFHKNCKGKYGSKKPVPAWMGWLWNATDECMLGGKYKFPNRPDWRPGAMNYKIARMIKRHRGGYEETEKPKRKPKKRKREEDEDIRPMIVIMKRQGCYLITMNPIANPYIPNEKNEQCAPIHFIVDQRKCIIERIKPKPKCDCNCECECEENEELKDKYSEILESEKSVEDEDDDDEFELEFTPPICLVDHETILKKKLDTDEKGTQTDPIVPPSRAGRSSQKSGKGKPAKKKK